MVFFMGTFRGTKRLEMIELEGREKGIVNIDLKELPLISGYFTS